VKVPFDENTGGVLCEPGVLIQQVRRRRNQARCVYPTRIWGDQIPERLNSLVVGD